MKDNQKNLEQYLSDVDFDDTPDHAHRDLLEQKLLLNFNSSSTRPNTKWRTIMNKRITKIAAAAVIMIAIGISFTIMEKTTTEAYAFEQTLEAMRSKRTAHIIGRDWNGSEFEFWMTLNDQSGLPDYVYLDYPVKDLKAVSTPEISYQYSKRSNIVHISNEQLINFDLRFETMFEDFIDATANGQGDKYNMYNETDPETGKELIIISKGSGDNETKVVIDSETKLPVEIHLDWEKNNHSFVSSFDQIYFYEDLPVGIFDFKIPEGATVIDDTEVENILNDPQYGISTEGLTQEQAALQIIEEYCLALIDFDFDAMSPLYPALNLVGPSILEDQFKDKPRPVEIVEIGQPYEERFATAGLTVPTILKYEDDTVKEHKIIVKFRQIDGQGSCVIIGIKYASRTIE